jgi:hypothetical protein
MYVSAVHNAYKNQHRADFISDFHVNYDQKTYRELNLEPDLQITEVFKYGRLSLRNVMPFSFVEK